MRERPQTSDQSLIFQIVGSALISMVIGAGMVFDGGGDSLEAIVGLLIFPLALGAMLQLLLPWTRQRALHRVRRHTQLG